MKLSDVICDTTEENILDGLNDKQREAVTAPFKPTAVIAGAGAGKTTVLTRRAAYFIYKGIAPENIVAITFTNKAAREMRERIIKLLGDKASHMTIKTFHSYCASILRSNADLLDGFTSNFSIIDEDDRKALIKECFTDLNYEEDKIGSALVCGNFIGKCKNLLITPDKIDEKAVIPERLEVYKLYDQKLKESNAMDFDDLLLKTFLLLKNNEQAAEWYQDQIKALLIDEYQDTNVAQYKLAEIWSKKNKNIFVVGDPDQAIYGFRQADFRNLLDFKKNFPQTNEIILAQNYRSTPDILEATNELIRNNDDRIPKDLWTEKTGHVPIEAARLRDASAEAEWIVRKIIEEVRNGHEPKDICILYRMHYVVKELEQWLLRANIPYVMYSGTEFLARAEVKDILAYLRIVENPRDLVSLRRIANVPARGLGEKSKRAMIDAIGKEGLIANAEKAAAILSSKAAEGIMSLKQAILTYDDESEEFLSQKIIKLAKEVGYIKMLEEKGDEQSKVRLENIYKLSSLADEFSLQSEERTLSSFLDFVTLKATDDAEEENKVSLMTCHRAKGLEFPVVFFMAVEEGVVPSFKSESKVAIEEERRVAYVAMTRAKEKLYLTAAALVRGEPRPISRFLKELPKEEIEVKNWVSDREAEGYGYKSDFYGYRRGGYGRNKRRYSKF